MKLLAQGRADLDSRIDKAHSPGASIVCRYRDVLSFIDSDDLDREFRRHLPEISIREGVRILPLMTYKGVSIHVLDETSWMASGSMKAIDGCLTACLCRIEGTSRIAFESGGNGGSALALYGRKAGLESYFFCPRENVDLLDSRLFESPMSHLVAVAERGLVKELASCFSKETGIRQVPDKSWRYAAAMFRGLHLLEHMLAGASYGWISQAISAAFGPIGIYKVLEAFRGEIGPVPRFLGIQQEGNCPMFRAWNPEAAGRLAAAGPATEKLLMPIMYDSRPETHETFRELRRLLVSTRGDVLTINPEEFESMLRPSAECGAVLALLRSLDIDIRTSGGQVTDKAGMIALAGTLKAIDTGIIPAGDSVLCALTGGASKADGKARPERTVVDRRDVMDYVESVREGS
jgi:threonine synthase